MLATVLGLLRFGVSLVFGLAVSVLFAGIESNRKNRLILSLLCVIFLFVQTFSWWLVGLELTSKLYPLITHLPIILIFSLYYKRPWPISIVSVLSGYLCCQAPRWVGFLAGELISNQLADHFFYITAVLVFYYFLEKYVTPSVRQLMERSVKSCLLLGCVPLFYYLFDYITAIYTDVLYSGSKWAIQFMPSTVSIFYFIFVIIYYGETQKQAVLQRERDMLDAQFRMARTEFDSLKQVQQNAASYRHDMRHHFALLMGLASEGNLGGIKEYLKAAQSDMDAITPMRFCQNETVNLILSSYAGKAKELGIIMDVECNLPDKLKLTDTELCSLLSNGLENAINKLRNIKEHEERVLRLKLFSKNSKLCVDIRNSCGEEPRFDDGMPVSNEKGHGFGTRSMVYTVEKHGGAFRFFQENGWFVFQATI